MGRCVETSVRKCPYRPYPILYCLLSRLYRPGIRADTTIDVSTPVHIMCYGFFMEIKSHWSVFHIVGVMCNWSVPREPKELCWRCNYWNHANAVVTGGIGLPPVSPAVPTKLAPWQLFFSVLIRHREDWSFCRLTCYFMKKGPVDSTRQIQWLLMM